MFGILRPCRHSLSEDLAREWMSHMCGLCLSLRDDHGQASRVATNYDGLVLSVLTAAQSEEQSGTRKAGRCPLRGMRGADVADGSGARLASTVSLMLASAKISDHIADGDGLYARPGVRAVAGRVAARWRRGAQESGDGLGLDGAALAAVVDRQREAELSAREGTDVLTVTRPTEEATGEAFAHTAVLAGVPANADPLREAGRLFGRAAHLLDAVEDLEEDLANGAWNPLTATGTPVSRARELCDDAVLGVGLALRETEFADDRLTRVLLVVELRKAVERVFAHAGHPTPSAHRGGADGEDTGTARTITGSSGRTITRTLTAGRAHLPEAAVVPPAAARSPPWRSRRAAGGSWPDARRRCSCAAPASSAAATRTPGPGRESPGTPCAIPVCVPATWASAALGAATRATAATAAAAPAAPDQGQRPQRSQLRHRRVAARLVLPPVARRGEFSLIRRHSCGSG